MSNQYTPGKWLLIRSGAKDNSAIATEEPKPETMTEPNYWTVASVNTLRAEWEANARLIAAAPDLLEALREVTHILDMVLGGVAGGYPPGADGPAVQARAAIKKATGES